jgi:PKHD-type hydroxylase
MQLSETVNFVDGRISNPHNKTKKNLQADQKHPGYRESTQILATALQRRREVGDFAMPRRFAPPLLCKYDKNMEYGVHADQAYVTVEGGKIRSDVSCTIFLSDPVSYEGGELRIQLGSKRMKVKGKPGSCLLYPSTTLHEVRPVTSGQRLVAITFIESIVPDAFQREMLYELNEVLALEGESMKWENRNRLGLVHQNLLRQWSS